MENKLVANIHSFETFGTVDGPGIRFIFFMQGCNLRCKYCHNRDTWRKNGGKKLTIDELMEKILKYKNYITPSGGVTASGGEPLLQASFLIELFKRLKKEGIHTCIDTSGMFPITDEIKELLSLTDLVLLDIKKCKDLVGFSNKLELEFARYLSDNGNKMWIRQVLVPGYTDDEQDLLKLKDFLSTLKNVEKFELLPYHNMGKYKWSDLGVEYELENVKPATQDDVDRAKKILGI